MGGKQKVKKSSNDLVFYVAFFALIIGAFVLLTPKVASMLFPFKRQMVLNDFLHEVQKMQTIPAQEFWKFREFYSPGSYVFNRDGLSGSEFAWAEKATGIMLSGPFIDRIFLTFSSPHTTSFEGLITTSDLAKVIDIGSLDKKKVLFSRTNELIYMDTKNMMHIVFVKSDAEMKTANGFFDYSGADKKLVSGKYWFDSTVVDGK